MHLRVLLIDNFGHGTGMLGILAGGKTSAHGGAFLGAVPDAEIVPLRVADRVVLLRTSALARALRYAADQRCDVVTLSLGGLPSRAWSEAVDLAYEAGVCICAAAGNHVGIAPPHTLVYPARYSRVLAVCGVMADGSSYTGLTGTALEGSFGPDSAMKAAIAAYTPNIPWAQFGCKSSIRLNGEGPSSATPQVAAAVALWFERYKSELPRDWRRVEAARHALFTTAKHKSDKKHFGNGALQAKAALSVKPMFGLAKSERADDSFAFLRVLTGIGLAAATPREQMFNLELAQRWLLNPELQKIVPDPGAPPTMTAFRQRRLMEAIVEDEGASVALRKHVAMRTIEHFEGSLGRPALWRPRINPRRPGDDRSFVQRLEIRPHALRQANAFYSPEQVALQFGYFEAGPELSGRTCAGQPRLHLPVARHRRARDHARAARRNTAALQRAHQSGRPRAARGVRRHHRADAALHESGDPRARDQPDAREHRGGIDAGQPRRPVRSDQRKPWRAARCERPDCGR
ncbi:MAG: S8 family serine peptidase [Acidobacteria bacterium]|nr:S8 family serine peptidase [Acidobacteriota bacterium]